MSGTMKRATQKDVAELANVSRATVSFVLNSSTQNRIPISEETRQRVIAAAKELNYSPDPVAQMLASGRKHLIGVFSYENLFPMQRDSFYYEFLLGIERGAAKEGYNVVLFTKLQADSQSRSVFCGGTNQLLLTDGTIFLGARPDKDDMKRLLNEKYPFIYIGRREIEDVSINYIGCDYSVGSRSIINHYLSKGHKHFAYVGPKQHNESDRQKVSAITEALNVDAQASLHIIEESDLEKSDSHFLSVLRENEVSAVLCTHSGVFEKVVDLLENNGIRIPMDMSVASLANIPSGARLPFIPSYIRVDRNLWGEKAFYDLLTILDNPGKSIKNSIDCDVVLGD